MRSFICTCYLCLNSCHVLPSRQFIYHQRLPLHADASRINRRGRARERPFLLQVFGEGVLESSVNELANDRQELSMKRVSKEERKKANSDGLTLKACPAPPEAMSRDGYCAE